MLADETESAFHLIRPRGIERPLRQLSAAPGKFVGGIVIDDKVDIVGRRNVLIDLAQEGKELLMTLAGSQGVITVYVATFSRQTEWLYRNEHDHG